jgi:hypothetical protein
MTNTSKGFSPSSNNPKTTAPPQTGGPSSARDDRPFRAQVAAEIAQLRNQLNDATNARVQGIQGIIDEYQEAAQPVVDQASVALYDALSGGSFFKGIATNVGALMTAHPTGERVTITAPKLKPASFAPLPQGTQQNYLTAMQPDTSTD